MCHQKGHAMPLANVSRRKLPGIRSRVCRSAVLVFGLSALASVAHGQSATVNFAQGAGGTGFDQGNGVAVDASGNTVVTGFFNGTNISFGTRPDNSAATLTSAGFDDIFIVKYNTAGQVVFAQSAGGTSADRGQGVAVDASGNTIVTGFFQGTNASFGTRPNNTTATLTSAGGIEIFVVSYAGEPGTPSPVSVTPGPGSNTVDYTAPANAGNVLILRLTNGAANPGVADGTTYTEGQTLAPGVTVVEIANPGGGNAGTFVDNNLTAGESYTYAVYAFAADAASTTTTGPNANFGAAAAAADAPLPVELSSFTGSATAQGVSLN